MLMYIGIEIEIFFLKQLPVVYTFTYDVIYKDFATQHTNIKTECLVNVLCHLTDNITLVYEDNY